MSTPISSDEASPFHRGERAIQERLGVRARVERGARSMLRDFMPDQHRDFYEDLPFLLVGSLDEAGRPWASLLQGEPGFVTAPGPRSLIVAAHPALGDPLAHNLQPGAPLGVLGIQLETRRRNRANGRLAWVSERGFELHVEQAFGNCPKYIQSRVRERPASRGVAGTPVFGASRLSEEALELLARCDTAFIASASAEAALGGREGVDVSHRGGLPGFIAHQTNDEGTRLTLPDYVGNFLFNTLGNIEVYPRAGLLCCDFSSGDLLSVTGGARAVWDGPRLASFEGAERLLEIDVERSVLLRSALRDDWSQPAFAREFLPR